jgi:AmiR/NasT family two-component response regulator
MGLLAERLDLDMDAAFKTLRRHAAAEDRTIEATATALVTGRLQPESVGQ